MARINIEDSLFKDARWWKLIIKVGCQYKGLGYLTKAWILAQEHWIEYGNVPSKAWPEELDILIEMELAVRNDDGSVYVKGSKKAFSWLEQRVEAGRKGGLKKRTQNEEGSVQEQIQRNGARAVLNKAVKNGQIEKPLVCQTCGIGGVVIEGHHSDYTKPLDVDWVCKGCHTKIHHAIRLAEAKRPLDHDNQPNNSAKAPSLPLSLPQEDLTRYEDLVVDSEKQQPTTTEPKFSIRPELRDDLLNEILGKISVQAQDRWLRTYKDPKWIKETLAEAISFYTARGDSTDGQWGVLLHRALKRAKAACKKAKPGNPSTTSIEDPTYWSEVFGKSGGEA